MTTMIDIIKAETGPATGCTEPAAVALASSVAYEQIGGRLLQLQVTTDWGVYKNGLQCILPGSGYRGLQMAAALGVVARNSSVGLDILKATSTQDEAAALELVREGGVSVTRLEDPSELRIEATATSDRGVSRCLIAGHHDSVIEIEVNGTLVHSKLVEEATSTLWPSGWGFNEIMAFGRSTPTTDLGFLVDGAKMNHALAQAGVSGAAGHGAGGTLSRMASAWDWQNQPDRGVETLVAAAIDARMNGALLPAWTVSGSGSHGVVATLPIWTVGQWQGIEESRVARALAISLLLTIYAKSFTGALSSLCGSASAAGAGASGGLCYLLGGDDEAVACSIQTLVAAVGGVICDGANATCAIKAATAARIAMTSAQICSSGMRIPPGTGILGRSVDETFRNLGILGSDGMRDANAVILSTMESGEECN